MYLQSLVSTNVFLGLQTFHLELPENRYLGLLVVCVKPYSAANLQNSIEENCGPLSDTTTCGIPCLAKTDFVCLITSAEDSPDNRAVSIYRE